MSYRGYHWGLIWIISVFISFAALQARHQPRVSSNMANVQQPLQVQVTKVSPSTLHYIVVRASDLQPLSARDALHMLSKAKEGNNSTLSNLLIETLTTCPFEAAFFEMPPLSSASLNSTSFEFVLVDAPALAGLHTDSKPFAAHVAVKNRLTVRFPNLGGDAMLIAPTLMTGTNNNCLTHLLSFLRHAPAVSIEAFLTDLGSTALVHIAKNGSRPLWISTSGLGVAYLHARLDSRPKYYQYAPFREIRKKIKL